MDKDIVNEALARYGEILGLVQLLERKLRTTRQIDAATAASLKKAMTLLHEYKSELEACGVLPATPTPRLERVN